LKAGVTGLALMISANASIAGDQVKKEIVERCRAQMGLYGSAMVKACVDQDIEALNALNSYPSEYAGIVSRCRKQMLKYGHAMVKACADQDIEAEKALGSYWKMSGIPERLEAIEKING